MEGDSSSSSSDESTILDAQKTGDGLRAYQFEPRREEGEQILETSSDSSESSGTDEATENRLERPHVDWCRCGHCCIDTLSRAKECICCHEKVGTKNVASPNNTDESICVVNNGDFMVLCLNRIVLRNVLVGLNNVRADNWNVNPPRNRAFRYAAYRQFTWWVHGKLGAGRRRVIPACVTHAVRQAFPKEQDELYEAFHSGGEDSDWD